ncbi:Crp/Fnr family transcriptional regulator [Pseudomonadota bacterium]
MNLLDIFENSDDLARFPAGGIILTEGQEGNNMYVVLDGEVTISLKSRLLATARVGEIVGEMSMVSSNLRSATVTAKTDCVLASIDQASFESLLKHVPEFTIHIMNVLADRLQNAFEMIEE